MEKSISTIVYKSSRYKTILFIMSKFDFEETRQEWECKGFLGSKTPKVTDIKCKNVKVGLIHLGLEVMEIINTVNVNNMKLAILMVSIGFVILILTIYSMVLEKQNRIKRLDCTSSLEILYNDNIKDTLNIKGQTWLDKGCIMSHNGHYTKVEACFVKHFRILNSDCK